MLEPRLVETSSSHFSVVLTALWRDTIFKIVSLSQAVSFETVFTIPKRNTLARGRILRGLMAVYLVIEF